MPIEKLIRVLCAVAMLVLTATAFAQSEPQEPPRPEAGTPPAYVKAETPEQRKARLGTPEDPGTDPDPNKHYWRFGHSFHIEKFDQTWAAFDQPIGFVRPFKMTPAVHEVYQQDHDWVWVWVMDPPPAAPPDTTAPDTTPDKYDDRTYDFLNRVRSQFTAYVPPASGKRVRFRESSTGLPNQGSWRNSCAIADMNGDGCPDLIAPPERKGNSTPAIFLGDCKGNWKIWTQARFSVGVDYGSVEAADFNKDGHMDLVFAVHLRGLVVYLNDGKGTFTAVNAGLPSDFPTRRVVVADVDKDGYPDIIASSEGPTQRLPGEGAAPLRAYLNRKKGTEWQGVPISSFDAHLGGDWLTVGKFNGDAYPDFVAASVYYGSMDVVFLSSGAKKWKKLESTGELLPSLSYYFASAAGHFTSRDRDDAIISYVRYWPGDANPKRVRFPELGEVTTIDRLSFTKDGVHRDPIARFAGHGGISGLAAGDFDGDKNLDLVYIVENPRSLGILLGDGHGGFRTAATEGIALREQRTYDVKAADVNKDGRPDIIVMYEAGGIRAYSDRAGSIHVYLNEGSDTVAPAPAPAPTPAK